MLENMSWEELELTIHAKVELRGTLTVPTHPDDRGEQGVKKPGILFISGSGPVDRNENTRRAKLNVFNYFASELGKNGFVSLRYDKRGVGKSEGDYWKTGFHDLVDDATRALDTLRDQPEVDKNRVFLFGHSEGCYIAPLVHRNSPVSGIILLMAPAEPLEEVLSYQAEAIQDDIKSMRGVRGWLIRLSLRISSGSDLKKTQQKLLEKVRQSAKPVIRYKLARVNAKWLREHFQLDVPEIYSSVDCPLLIINGAKDIQVKAADAEKVSKYVRRPVEWHVVDEMTHLLRKDKEKPSVLHYKKLLKNPVDPEILELVVKWFHGLSVLPLEHKG